MNLSKKWYRAPVVAFCAKVFYFLSTSVLLMWAAFVNGYPLVFPDAGTYIISSFTLIPPLDRPIGYGFFIRLFSFPGSLWSVVFVQSFLVSYFTYCVMKVRVSKASPKIHLEKYSFLNNIYFFHGLTILFLAIFTGVSWFSGQIIPDIFLSIIFLLIYVFLVQENRWYHVFFFLPVFFLMLLTHTANFLISFGLLVLLGIYFLLKKKQIPYLKSLLKKLGILLSVVLLATVFLMFYNDHYGKGFTVNPSSYVFIMSRFNESGLLKKFLIEHCPQKSYDLCPYQDHLLMGDEFIWNSQSPVNKIGWIRSKSEYQEIISKIIVNPENFFYFGWDSAKRTLRLMTSIKLDIFLPYRKDSSVYNVVRKYFPHEERQFISTRQFQDQLFWEDIFSYTYIPVVLFSLFVLGYFLRKKILHQDEKILLMVVFVGLFSNAIVMATLSGVYGRYNSRMMWLIPFVAVVLSRRVFV